MELPVTKKQLKTILKLLLKSRRTFESLAKETGIDDSIRFPSQLNYDQAELLIKTHSGFLI